MTIRSRQTVKPLPQERDYDEILNHYLVEKAIAKRIKESNLEQRKKLLPCIYEELFSRVPNHPRLVLNETKNMKNKAIKNKLIMINKHLHKSTVFVEFAPGDCMLSIEIAKHVDCIYGIDISDQRPNELPCPDNFTLVIYDGYSQEIIPEDTVDIVFSDQLIEHIHPDDIELHFDLVYKILKKGGRYIFRTPHRLSGPHDVSQYFSEEPECFHLKEWSFDEIKVIVQKLNFTNIIARWKRGVIDLRLPCLYFLAWEKMLPSIPRKQRVILAKILLPSVYCEIIK